MRFGKIQSNPRFAELCETLAAHPEWLTPWTGSFFRFQTIDFPTAKDVLSGEGARQRGGRWNQPGTVALYGSTTDRTALEECKANDRYYGVETKSPRLLVAIEARTVAMLDLTSAAVRRGLRITLKELAAEDWRKLLQSGNESTAQALGRAAICVGASGLLVRSAATLGINVVIFPDVNDRDRFTVVEGDKLSSLPGKSGT